MRRLLSILSVLLCAISLYAAISDGLSAVPEGQRKALSGRLTQYVTAYRSRDWGKLYELVSAKGKGGVDKQQFISAMDAEHGRDFAQMPDLVAFTPMKTDKVSDGLNIYGCGKAQREGMNFKGIAVVHAVVEKESWTFSGWSFTMFPNEPCKSLESPSWLPVSRFEFTEPMEEIRHAKSYGTPFHVDPPK